MEREVSSSTQKQALNALVFVAVFATKSPAAYLPGKVPASLRSVRKCSQLEGVYVELSTTSQLA
jgi:hypothetical protein